MMTPSTGRNNNINKQFFVNTKLNLSLMTLNR